MLVRLALVALTFVLIVVLAQVALTAARTRPAHAAIDQVAAQAWEGTQDYFLNLFAGSLGEASSTSVLGGDRRPVGEILPVGAVRSVQGVNVVGLLPAARPSERERYVLVGGHLDGVGTDPDGTVYPGANDNASGVAVTIEVARVLASQRDRLRAGVVFVAFAAEEEGLRGSEQFVQKTLATPYRPQNLAAYLNLDVTGCCGERLAASEESFALHARLQAAAERHGVPSTFGGGNSDHFTFARRGVPAVLLSWEDARGIHTTADTVATITAARLRAAGVVAAQAVLELARGE